MASVMYNRYVNLLTGNLFPFCVIYRPKNEKNLIFSLDSVIFQCYNSNAQVSRYGSPSSPQARAKGLTSNNSAEASALFCCDVGAKPATHIFYCLEVLSHR